MTGAVFTSYALYLALETGDAFRIARGLTWEAAIAASQSRGGKRHAERLFSMCRPVVRELNHPYATAMLALTEGQAHFSHGRWQQALEKFEGARRGFVKQCTGSSFELATLEGFRLQTLAYMGDYNKLRLSAAELLDASRSLGDLYLETFVRGAIQPLVFLADDRPDLARASIGTAMQQWSAPGYHLQHALIDQVRVWTELYCGDPDAADSLITRQWPLLRRSHLLFNQNLRAKLLELRARCSLAADASPRRDHHRRVSAASILQKLEGEQEAYLQGSVLGMRALLHHRDGHTRQAATLLGQAADMYDAWDMGDYAAAARLTLAGWTGGEQGDALRGAALAWMSGQQIRNPDRWARMRFPIPT